MQNVYLYNKRVYVGLKKITKEKRWFKDVGLGFKTPSEAINGTYIGTLPIIYIERIVASERGLECRQEMPLHLWCIYPRPYPHRTGGLHQNDPHHHSPTGLPPLYPKIQCVLSLNIVWLIILISTSIDRYEKRHRNLAAHVSPAFRVEVGDLVTVGMCCLTT